MFTAMAISHSMTTVLKSFETLQLSTLVLSGLPKFEVRGEDIINQVIEVVSLDEPLALVARVHGCPAELILRSLPLHEAPDRLPHYWYRFHVWPKEQQLSRFVDLNPLMEELTCKYTGSIGTMDAHTPSI